jgi:hypothetical protein
VLLHRSLVMHPQLPKRPLSQQTCVVSACVCDVRHCWCCVVVTQDGIGAFQCPAHKGALVCQRTVTCSQRSTHLPVKLSLLLFRCLQTNAHFPRLFFTQANQVGHYQASSTSTNGRSPRTILRRQRCPATLGRPPVPSQDTCQIPRCTSEDCGSH